MADPSVALGYWRKPEDSAATFQARLTDEPGAGPFLRTGDLGLLLDGQLYMTGRLKDLVIIAGANHYPQDIEWTVQSHCPELRRDHCAAFSIGGEVGGDGGERLVILAEPERLLDDWDPLFRRIRTAVADHHDIAVSAIVLLKRGGILKTSSGKLQRRACQSAFLESQLDGSRSCGMRPRQSSWPSGAISSPPKPTWIWTVSVGTMSDLFATTSPSAVKSPTSFGSSRRPSTAAAWLSRSCLGPTRRPSFLRAYLMNS